MTGIFVVCDRLTKYAHFLPLAHPFGAAKVAQLFMDNIVRLHGWPSEIISDRDSIFMSSFWTKLMKKHHRSGFFCHNTKPPTSVLPLD